MMTWRLLGPYLRGSDKVKSKTRIKRKFEKSSDFSDFPDMTDEYIDLSVYALTGLLLYILYLTLYTKVKCIKKVYKHNIL